jgi:hypothetical protein
VSAPQFNPIVDTLLIRGDSAVALTYALRAQGAPVPFVVQVRDKGRNPVPGVAVRFKGTSGREYAVATDERGMANAEYDPATEGGSPMVELSAPSLGPEYARSAPRPQKVAGKLLSIDINDYFPYDASLEKLLGQGGSLVSKEEWKDAIAPLQQAVALRPGQGSGRAYALLAQAWFEEDEDNFNEALKAARKAIADQKNVTGSGATRIIEKMHYYHVRALNEAYDRSKDAGTKQDLRAACRNYLNLLKEGEFASLRKQNSEVRDHEEKVKDIQDDVK